MLKPMAPKGYQVIMLFYYHSVDCLSPRMVLCCAIQGKQGIPSEKQWYLWILAAGLSFLLVIPAAWYQAVFI